MIKKIKIPFIFSLLFLVSGFCYGNDKDANYQKYLSHTSANTGANVYNLANNLRKVNLVRSTKNFYTKMKEVMYQTCGFK